MQIEITYIFHNCFVLKAGARTFLFDYPADNYLDENMRTVLIHKIKDAALYIFSSHNHQDHFNRNVDALSAYAQSSTYILSKDIVKKNRKFKEMPSCITAAPDQSYSTDGMTIRTFLSNDEGVAFLISTDNLNIYFGGDLANWQWDDLTKEETRVLVDYFGEVLTRLKQWPIQIGFSNTDPRLKNWSGAAQFIQTIKPNLFVPMHTFGETGSIAKFLIENPAQHRSAEQAVFQYQKTGDFIVREFPI
jgi:L-ascorbate metabolism protein UlaG (beta-lactamase superfamily)